MTAFLNSTSSPQARPLSVTLQGELRHARSSVRARVRACVHLCVPPVTGPHALVLRMFSFFALPSVVR